MRVRAHGTRLRPERHNRNRHLHDCRLARGGEGQDRRSQHQPYIPARGFALLSFSAASSRQEAGEGYRADACANAFAEGAGARLRACGCGTAIRRWSNPCRSAFIHGPFPNRGVWGLVVASTGGRSWRPVALLDERMSGVVCFCGDLNLCTHQVSSNSAAAGLASLAFRLSVVGASGSHSQMCTLP